MKKRLKRDQVVLITSKFKRLLTRRTRCATSTV